MGRPWARTPRWLLAGAAILTLLVALAAAVRWHAVRGLRERSAALRALVTQAAASSAAAQERLRSGEFDLAARAASPLVGRLLEEFEGYEQVTRRGNRFRIGRGETRFRDGYAELDAEAEFDWRWGLYDGPIEATYLAFARIAPGGGCDLYFRVAEVRTLAPSKLFNWYFAPILTYRMQRGLEIPNLRLPLGLRREAGRPDLEREVRRGVAITVPDRPLGLGPRRVLPFVVPEAVGVVVERMERVKASSAVRSEAAPPPPGADGVEIAARVEFLSDLLAAAVAPEEDLRLEVERIPGVWRSRFLGFDNQVDVARLAGALDLQDAGMALRDGALQVEAALEGRFVGILEGKLVGVNFSVPFTVRSRAREVLPLRIAAENSGLQLIIQRDEIEVPLDVEARVRRRPIRFRHKLRVPAATLAHAARLPGLVMTELKLPTRVERREVRASKHVPATIAWEVEPPVDGLLRARGKVTIGDEG